MNSLQQTLKIINTNASPFTRAMCPIDTLDRHILAEDIAADRDYPPFHRVAMDGVAIRYRDWELGMRQFRVRKTIYAGDIVEDEIGSGECFIIMTGAACLRGADVIVRKEDIQYRGDLVDIISSEIKCFQNIAKKGEDCLKGELIISAGTRCNPPLIAVLAAFGKSKVSVIQMPTTAVVTTGSEVVQIEQRATVFQIRNSNGYLLQSMLKKWGILPEFNAHTHDDKESLRATLEIALKQKLVLINGGISVGEADFVLEVLQDLDVEILFSRVAIRPGKPVTVGRSKNGTFVFALPGNPLSCMLTFILFVEHYLIACCGLREQRALKASINFFRKNKSGLDEFFPVQFNSNGSELEELPSNGSGDITAALGAIGFGWHPKELHELHPGQLISYIPF